MTSYSDSDFLMGKVPSVNALLGLVTESRTKTGDHSRKSGVYIWDGRKDSPYKAKHDESGNWVSYYCQPTEYLMAVYRQRAGEGDFSLSCLRIIPWQDGSVRMFGQPRCGIGSTPLAFEVAA